MRVPVVHLNGTSKEELMRLHLNVADALRKAMTALSNAAPHPRDYLGEGTFEEAQALHRARMDALKRVADENQSILLGIDAQRSQSRRADG